MIRRFALAAALLVLVAVLGLPPVFGGRARGLIEAELAAFGDTLAPNVGFSVSLDEWETGWFSSTATVTVALDAQQTTWRDAVTLYHGPVIFGGVSGLGWGSAEFVVDTETVPALAGFGARTGVQEVGRIAAVVGLFGGTAIDVAVHPFQTRDGPDGTASFNGLNARVVVNRAASRVAVTGTMPGGTMMAPDAPLITFTGLEGEVRARRAPSPTDLWLGDGGFDLAGLVVQDRESGNALEMEGARFEAEVVIDGEELVWTSRHTARVVRVATIPLDDVELDVAITYPLAAVPRVSEADAEKLATDFIREHMTLRVDPLRFSHLDLPLVAKLDVDYRGDRLPIGATPDVATLPGFVAADMELVMHKELFGAFGFGLGEQLARAMVDQGLAAESGDSYEVQASFRDGQLTTNGRQIDLSLLLALLAGA